MKSRSPQLLIFLTIFIDLLGFGMVLPIASVIAKRYAHPGALQELEVGFLMASYSLCQMIFAPIWGRLSDRVGRRPILLLSLFGSVVSYTIFGMATNYWMLLVGRTFAGICAANLTAAQAYIADITPPEKRTAAMGHIGAAFGLGFTIGPVFGGVMTWLAHRLSPDLPEQRYPGLAAGAICLMNFLWALRALPESLSAELRAKVRSERRLAPIREVLASLSHPTIGPLVGVFFLSTLAFANLEVSLSPYINDRTGLDRRLDLVYALFFYIGVVMIFMQGWLVRKAVKIVPEAILVIVGTMAQSAGLLLVPLLPAYLWLYVPMSIIAFGQGVGSPSLLGLVSQTTSATHQGRVSGVTQSASSLGRIFGPILATGLWKFYGLRAPFVVGGLIMLGAVWLAVVTRRRIVNRGMEAIAGE